MDERQARVNVARNLGGAALTAGLLVAVAGRWFLDTPYVFAALLVATGLGMRIEAAILDRR